METALACSRLGAIFVPANPLLRLRQLAYLLRDSGARVMVSSDPSAKTAADLLASCPDLRTIIACDASTTGRGALRYDELLPAADACAVARAIDRDPAAILYTSGSTGKPKGVVVSHRNLVAGALCLASYLGNEADDRQQLQLMELRGQSMHTIQH